MVRRRILSGLVPATPPRRTKGPQTRWRAMADRAVLPQPTTDMPPIWRRRWPNQKVDTEARGRRRRLTVCQ
jgi:hypothetical protein